MNDPSAVDQLMNGQDIIEGQQGMPKKVKAKRYNGLLEWITEREGHEFLVQIDRGFLKDKMGLIGIKEKFIKELNLANDRDSEKKFNMMLTHLFQSSCPTPEALADEKYV